MEYFIDVAAESINKNGEVLCGDKVEIVPKEDGMIIVLADGLGSGVKANILSTLTSKIAATMMKQGADIRETIDTITHTLPVCSQRKLAYSTFTIVDIHNDGRVYVAEYDNPPFFLIKNNKVCEIDKVETKMNDRLILESHFHLQEGDTLVIVSDGVIHAGIGATLKLGWQWNNISKYLNTLIKKEKLARDINQKILEIAKRLYRSKPGDDTTAVVIKLMKKETANIFTGPPKAAKDDDMIVKKLLDSDGKKIICGGTAATIVSRILKEKMDVDINTMTKEIPPIAKMKGIDLVTEGVLTLSKTADNIKKYIEYISSGRTDDELENIMKEQNGASQLSRLLIRDCTHINFFVGKAVNSAHQNPNLPIDLSIKLKVVEEIVNLLRNMGKISKITYID